MTKKSEQDVQSWLERQGAAQTEVDLSIVIPAYNEERRLPSTLVDMIDFFDSRGDRYEILVIDDGSNDGTLAVAQKFERLRDQVSVIRVPENQGKGHAVRTGMLNAHGKRVLFADADGATPIAEISRLEAELELGADLAIGSRALHSAETKVTTRWYRKYLGRVFNFVVNILVLPGIADTQCGFKIFTARACKFLFENQTAQGYSFDVEILLLAGKAGMKISEVPINWQNVPGSKVNLILDSAKMLRDIIVFKLRHRAVSPKDFTR